MESCGLCAGCLRASVRVCNVRCVCVCDVCACAMCVGAGNVRVCVCVSAICCSEGFVPEGAQISGKKVCCRSALFSRKSSGLSEKKLAAAAFRVGEVETSSSRTRNAAAARFFSESPQDFGKKSLLPQRRFFMEILRINFASAGMAPRTTKDQKLSPRQEMNGNWSQNKK